MAVPTLISIPKLPLFPQTNRTHFLLSAKQRSQFSSPIESCSSQNLKNAATILGVTGIALATLMVGPETASASEIAIMGSSFQFNEPSNALSLPTWAIHVSSVVEWYLLCNTPLFLLPFSIYLARVVERLQLLGVWYEGKII